MSSLLGTIPAAQSATTFTGAIAAAPVKGRTAIAEWNTLHYAALDSTNKEAARQISQGTLTHDTVLVADTQSAGQGRFSRVWESPSHQGLWASAVCFVPLSLVPLERVAQSTLVLAVAVTEAIGACTGRTPLIKWPNDLLFDSRKCAGLLVETGLMPEENGVTPLIMGMGINLMQQTRDFPQELQAKATSLHLATGHAPDKFTLLQAILGRLNHWLRCWETQGFSPVRSTWLQHNHTLGRRITLAGDSGTFSGVASDLDTDGALLVRTETGGIHRVDSGEICFSESYSERGVDNG